MPVWSPGRHIPTQKIPKCPPGSRPTSKAREKRLIALSTMSLPSLQTVTKEDEVGMEVDWIENFRPVWQRIIRSESTQDKAGSLPPASRDYVMLFAIFLNWAKTFFCINWIPKIIVQFCYLRISFGIYIVSIRLLQWIAWIENGLKLRPTRRYRTHTVISTR